LPCVFSVLDLTFQAPAESLHRGDNLFHSVESLSLLPGPRQYAPHVLQNAVSFTQFRQQHWDVRRLGVRRIETVTKHL